MRVQVHELDAHLLERALRQQVPLDARKRLVRVVERLLDQTQLLALALVQLGGDGEVLLQTLQRQDEQLAVVLVRERRERDRRELARLQPVHGGGVDRHGFFRGDVRAVFQVVVLAFLLSLQPKSSQPSEVFPAHRLVHRRAAPDALAVVVRDVGPPVSLALDVPQDHVFHGRGQTGHLPRDVRLPAPPCL